VITATPSRELVRQRLCDSLKNINPSTKSLNQRQLIRINILYLVSLIIPLPHSSTLSEIFLFNLEKLTSSKAYLFSNSLFFSKISPSLSKAFLLPTQNALPLRSSSISFLITFTYSRTLSLCRRTRTLPKPPSRRSRNSRDKMGRTRCRRISRLSSQRQGIQRRKSSYRCREIKQRIKDETTRYPESPVIQCIGFVIPAGDEIL
jgi:hypothetical protein